jgi:hypothetical protein
MESLITCFISITIELSNKCKIPSRMPLMGIITLYWQTFIYNFTNDIYSLNAWSLITSVNHLYNIYFFNLKSPRYWYYHTHVVIVMSPRYWYYRTHVVIVMSPRYWYYRTHVVIVMSLMYWYYRTHVVIVMSLMYWYYRTHVVIVMSPMYWYYRTHVVIVMSPSLVRETCCFLLFFNTPCDKQTKQNWTIPQCCNWCFRNQVLYIKQLLAHYSAISSAPHDRTHVRYTTNKLTYRAADRGVVSLGKPVHGP